MAWLRRCSEHLLPVGRVQQVKLMRAGAVGECFVAGRICGRSLFFHRRKGAPQRQAQRQAAFELRRIQDRFGCQSTRRQSVRLFVPPAFSVKNTCGAAQAAQESSEVSCFGIEHSTFLHPPSRAILPATTFSQPTPLPRWVMDLKIHSRFLSRVVSLVSKYLPCRGLGAAARHENQWVVMRTPCEMP